MDIRRFLSYRDYPIVRAVTERIRLRLVFKGCNLRAGRPLAEAEFTYRFNAWRKTQPRQSSMECIKVCETRLSQGKKMPWETGKGK